MLPDFPSLKTDVEGFLDRFLHARMMYHRGWFSEMKRTTIHEGRGTRIIRADGSMDDSGYKTFSARTEIPVEAVPTMSAAEVMEKLDGVARELVEQELRHLFDVVSKAAESVGNVADAGGKPISHDFILEMLEKVQVDFSDDGEPLWPALHIPPSAKERVIQLIKEAEDDSELKHRFAELEIKKRGEWRAREADRRLVG